MIPSFHAILSVTFKAAGFNAPSITEVILTLSQKVMSNYLNPMPNTAVDDAFAHFSWSKKEN